MKNIADTNKKYYVYIIFDTLNNPFYVGKGSGKRYNNHFLKRNLNKFSAKSEKIKQIYTTTGNWPAVRIYKDHLTAKEAFMLEEQLILLYGRKDKGTGILLNKTNGGGRETGWVMPDKIRQKISKALKGKTKNITWGHNISKALKGRVFTAKHKKKIQQSNLQRVKKGIHNFTTDHAKRIALDRVKNGTHHFLNSNFNKKPFTLICSDGRYWRFESKVDAVRAGFTASLISALRKYGVFTFVKGTTRKTRVGFKQGDSLQYKPLHCNDGVVV